MEELSLEGLAIGLQEQTEKECVEGCDCGIHRDADGVGTPRGQPGLDPVDEVPRQKEIGSLDWVPHEDVDEPLPDLF